MMCSGRPVRFDRGDSTYEAVGRTAVGNTTPLAR